MTTTTLSFLRGHYFLESGGGLWLIDTGSPISFGAPGSLNLVGRDFPVTETLLDLTAADLSGFLGVECAGLLGADVLGQVDSILDTPGGSITLSLSELEHPGNAVEMDVSLKAPIVRARIGDTNHRMYFDTDAQLSYFQHESLATYPPAGTFTDFYPGIGPFQTETYMVDVALGGLRFTLRCGRLPRVLRAGLMLEDTDGIVGNEVLRDRLVGYFPRRELLVL
jgi:hypothetical protein